MNESFDDANRRKLFASMLGADDFKPASAVVRAEVAARSHRGRVFKEDEDHYLALRLTRSEETLHAILVSRDVPHQFEECAYAAVVADGVGGHGAGAVAARLAVSTLAHNGLTDMIPDDEIADALALPSFPRNSTRP